MKNRLLAAFLVAVPLVLAPIAHAAPLGTAFTYQGSLNESGSPATGLYDLQFALYDATSAGAQVGSTLTLTAVNVTAGVFTVNLDFGATAFNDQARWLEIAVRPNGGGAYTTLSPRQALTGAPVALYALSGGNWRQTGATLTNNSTSNIVLVNRTNRIGSEYFGVEAPVAAGQFGGMYLDTQDPAGWPFYGYATGGVYHAWTMYNGQNGDWSLYNGGTRMTVQSTGNVGVGTSSPGARLDVTTGGSDAVHGNSSAANSNGVWGSGLAAGVYGLAGSSNGAGVLGHSDGASGTGVWGEASQAGAAGVAGFDNFGTGVYGQSTNGYGVYGSNGGSNTTGYAGYFNGRVFVNGQLSKASGSFTIDHPLDPANKTLSHSFVESPDMMNLYNGNTETDADGRAEITLPVWFQALNRDFRYQLTPIGTFAQAMVEQEIEGNRFVIRTDKPHVRVSWQVSGVRHDAYADAHRIRVEEEKPVAMKGKYLFPEGFTRNAEDARRHAAFPPAAPEVAAAAASAPKGTR